jgi:hypothetical protein
MVGEEFRVGGEPGAEDRRGREPPAGSKAQAVEILMIVPLSCFAMTGATSRVARTTFIR